MKKILKKVKFWEKMSFWTKLKALIASLGIGSEFAAFILEAHPALKTVIAILTLVGILITFFIEDNDNDGIVDVFEDDEPRKH